MRKVLPFIDLNDGGIHLDIGTGRGDGTALIGRYKRTVGLEYGTLVSKVARQQYSNIIQGNAAFMPFKDGVFSSITILDVLEHIMKPEASLREMKRVLKDGGTLVLQTPSKESFRLKKVGVILNSPVMYFVLVFKYIFNNPKYLVTKIFNKNRRETNCKPHQPLELKRSLNSLKQIINSCFNIVSYKRIRYWNQWKIIEIFSFSDCFICKKERKKP